MEATFLKEFEPFLQQVSSEKMRDAVRAIWEDLFEQSEWKDIYDVPSELSPVAIPLVQHSCNVASYVIGLADVYGPAYADKGMTFDKDTLITGALLHDVSKLLEFRPTIGGAERTELGRLYGENFFGINQAMAKDLSLEVLHILASDPVKTKTPPDTSEALLVYFADRIDMDVRNLRAGRPLRAKDSEYNILNRY